MKISNKVTGLRANILPSAFFALLLTGSSAAATAPMQVSEVKAAKQFVTEVSRRTAFSATELAAILTQAEYRPDIIERISNPAEAMPWHRYRPIFLTEERIGAGVEFWDTHAALISRIATEYRVAPEILVAIIGVETYFGRHRGQHRVLDALTTLAFYYPPRASFFKRELEEFLVLAREEDLPPAELLGSYAGAMGMPQFISSSYRAYAVDGDGDGRRDLFDNPADIIASVANYFRRHDWRAGEPVAFRTRVQGDQWRSLTKGGLRPVHNIEQLRSAGISEVHGLAPDTRVRLLALDTANGDEHWLTLHNFYVITRYNHSPLYAMAVYQLGQQIRARREAAR